MIKTQQKIVRRAKAFIIDYLLIFGLFYALMIYYFGVPNDDGGISLEGLGALLFLLFWILYFPVMEFLKGQTLGKILIGLKVVTKNGHSISLSQAFKRRILDAIDFPLYGIVAIIAVKKTPDHQRLGDLWAETVVAGGEETHCYSCRELLVLNFNEVIAGQFECSKCGVRNEYGLN